MIPPLLTLLTEESGGGTEPHKAIFDVGFILVH